MKKVVSVNLNGRAYQIEEPGYEALQTYLSTADKSLARNPDKLEIVADLEQSIAEKCESELVRGKNVVSTVAIEKILDQVGPVEPMEQEDIASATPSNDTIRKLYLLPKEGKISGVCAGLAAYLGVDVTIVRLLFILLVFLTQGFMVLIYILLVIAMNEAKTPEEIALAHGRPVTARDIMNKVRIDQPDKDTIARIGTLVTQVGRGVALVLAWAGITVLMVVSIAWVWLLWAIALEKFVFFDQLQDLNGWKQVVIATATYLFVTIPLFWLIRTMYTVGKNEPGEAVVPESKFSHLGLTVVWVLALATLIAFGNLYASSVRTYVETHDGNFEISDHSWCVDQQRCGTERSYYRIDTPVLESTRCQSILAADCVTSQ